MKYKFILFLIFIQTALFGQGEANIWYFGENAGLDFNNGAPVALTNGQLITDEGCATISNANGQLLFYTDGTTVYNKNHSIMINGSGLQGHPSSTQSATIVKKPGVSNLFYIFTTDNEHDPNGFRYSIVDLNLDNGNGAVTTDKNILVHAPTIEGLAITKHGNDQDFWIITHGWDGNSFICYLLTFAGLSTNPIISNIGIPITGTGFVAAGSIKVSPSGNKLAITSVSDFAQLFNFNNVTGSITNELTLITEPGELISAAFSPDETLLYVSNSFGKIHQFNLMASDIPNSKITIFNGSVPGQMQIGPDNKIYIAYGNRTKLGVINNPNNIGTACDFVLDGIDLGGKLSKLGLPSFNQSFFFVPSIQVASNCEGEISNFSFTSNLPIISATWDFGDGQNSSILNPTHIYAASGTYTVMVTITTQFGSGSSSRQIIVNPKPILISNQTSLKQCDDDLDGYSSFNLLEAKSLFTSSPSDVIFNFFETLQEAQDNSNEILNTTNYTNLAINSDTVFVKITNNNGCYQIAQLDLIVSTTLIPSSFQKIYTKCDDAISGSNTDGISTFNFSNATAEIQGLYPVGQLLDITFYNNQADALSEQNAITNTANFSNTNYPNSQNIYVRVDSQLNNECLGLGHHITLTVEPIPIAQPQIFIQCDDDQDGLFAFDTSNLENNLLNGLNNVTVTYADSSGNSVNLTNPFPSASQVVYATITNNYGNQCAYTTTIQFQVDVLPQAFPIPNNLIQICDDETNPSLQNGTASFDTSTFQATIVGNQIGMLVSYFDANNVPLSSPLPNPFLSPSQIITAEVRNPNNPNCKITLSIPFVVLPTPIIELTGNELICSNNTNFVKTINAGLLNPALSNNYSYAWFLDGILIPNELNYGLTINSEGVYTVNVTNANNCTKTRTITVTASSIAVIENISINDLTENNSILITVSGSGDYSYSLDGINYQTSNYFSNIVPNTYILYVKDNNECGIAVENINVLGIPKFFTPNGDGANDYWVLQGSNQNVKAGEYIDIFDRYGKLIKRITDFRKGWDGTYNNQLLPAQDYWFQIHFQNGRTVKGHFALKR